MPSGPILKTILFTILAPGSVLVLVPCWILDGFPRPESSPRKWLGVLTMLLGSAIYFRSTWEFAVRGLGTPAPIAPTRFLVTDGPQPVRPQPPCTLACSLSYLARQQHCTPCDSWAAPHSAAFRYNCLSSMTNNPRSAASSAIRTSHIAAPSRGGFRGSNSASRVGTATEFIDSRPAAEAS